VDPVITSSTYCRCGSHLIVKSTSWRVVQDIDAAFTAHHTGDDHELFPTQREAEAAQRAVDE
jgi:hypothetical protein